MTDYDDDGYYANRDAGYFANAAAEYDRDQAFRRAKRNKAFWKSLGQLEPIKAPGLERRLARSRQRNAVDRERCAKRRDRQRERECISCV